MKRALALLIPLLLCPALRADVATTAETLRQQALALINRDRVAAGLAPVKLDAGVSAYADDYCRAQIRNRTTGHYTIDGLAPYMRYSFAGGNDGLLENTAGWSAHYRFNERALREMVQRSHDSMMKERAPDDGHRRAILDPFATHVGIGVAWERGEFRIAQEFVRRWIAWERPLPRAATLDSFVSTAGRVAPGVSVEAIAVHHEPFPAALTAAEASAHSEYALPPHRREYVPRAAHDQTAATGMAAARRGAFPVDETGRFSFNVPLSDGPGIYTVVVWLRKGESTFSASNVSLRVDDAAAAAMPRGGR